MGAKSTNITSQQMLPLFQVLSDLEKPYESSLSLGTSVSDIYLNKKTILDNDDFIIHHYSSGDLVQNRGVNTRYCQTNDSPLVYGKYFHTGNTRHRCKSKNRRKYRRRLKIEHGAMDEIRFKFNGHSLPEKQRKNRSKNEKKTSRKHYSTKQNEGPKNTDSSPDYDNKLLKKRIGLFTEMGLNAYNVKGDIDISRHFKNISREDLINSETDNPTTGIEQSDPIYEVPKNVRVKKTDACGSLENIGNVVSSAGKMSRKKIIHKYEEMLAALMEKNQNNALMVREKDSYINKIKSKLKELLSVNNQFADENEYMKKQHDDMKVCIEHYKSLVKSLEEHVEKRDQVIESFKGKCGQCNDKEVIAMKAERQSAQLSEDLLMLKNVVYRLNLQLSLYQDKMRNMKNSTIKSKNAPTVPHLETIDNIENAQLPVIDEVDEISIPPIPNFEKTNEGDLHTDASEKRSKFIHQDTYSIEQDVGMVWGDVNTHTLGPLLNAYQESIVEKDQLVRDYECEFNRFTAKLKYIVEENDAMHEAITKMANELSGYKEKCGLAVTERDTLRKECDSLKEKVDSLSAKLNEVHTLYEQKVDTMTRDYTLIHEEYFQCKSNLASAQSKIQILQEQCAGLKDQDVVPSNIHQTRIEECKRLFEDLKVRYDNDKERLNTKINLMQQSNELTERRIIDVTCEKQKLENKLKISNHFVKKCRKEIHILKNELEMTKSARDAARRRAGQATAIYKQMAMEFSKGDHIQKIKNEKIRETFKELDALEKLLKEKDDAMEAMKEENEQEVSRLKEMLMENTASVAAMKKHINQERIKRYGSLQHINTTLPESFSNLKLSSVQKEGGSNLPSANIIPVRGGYFIHKDRHKPTS